MSNVLVGVGGSGQHVVHAYLRMLALTACRASDIPNVYIVDADARVGESGLCSDIAELHQRLTQPVAQENRPCFALIRPYFEPHADSTPGLAQKNLELDACPEVIKDIFLTDDPADGAHASANDRTVDLLQGMMANAKVGAMAFGFKVMRVGSDKSLIEVNFGAPDRGGKASFNLLSDVKNARVAVVGSSFGGTGSGVIPALVRFLSAQAAGRPVAVRAFMTLPWFEIDAGGNSAASIQAGGIDPKKRNAALGLRTYLSELDNATGNSNYVVAQFLGDTATRQDRGNYNQGEDPHVFNLVLATSIQSFLLETVDTGAVAGGGQGRRKLYGMFTDKSEEADGVFTADKSSHLRFRVKPDDNRQFLDIVKEADVLALVLEKGAEFITPGPNQFKVEGAVKQTEPEALIELCKNIATTYEKKPLIKKGSFFMKKELAPDEVYGKLAEALRRVSTTVRRSLLWVDDHRKTDDRPSGIAFPPLGHLFVVQKADGRSLDILPASEDYLRAQWDAYGLNIKRKEGKGKATELTAKTERISQAFALFMNCMFNDKNYVEELMSLSTNQAGAPIYEVAAQMLAEAVFAEVIEARAASRSTDNLRDAQDNRKATGQLKAFIKGVMVNPDPDGSRLCVLSKSMLDGAVGDAVGGSSQDPIHEDHPVSLRQIDPYLGISKEQNYDISAVAKLAAGTAWFPESALKGIPNVIAPLLLQEWRLGLSRHTSSDEEGLFEQRNSVRLSQLGLFQHATKVVEAGFWLTFTKDSRVKLIDLDTNQGLRNSAFCQLVNKELKDHKGSAVENALPSRALVLSDSQGKNAGRVVLVADSHCGWYLPANSVARQFFGRIMAELPSVKYGRFKLDRAWVGHGAPEQPTPGSFDANLIAGFQAFVKRIVKMAGKNTAPWVVAMREVETCIDRLGLEESSLQFQRSGSFFLELGAGAEVTEVALLSPKALDNIKDLLIEKPVYFFVGDENKGTDAWNELWPIKGAAWEHLDPPEKSEAASPITAVCTVARDSHIDQRSAWEIVNLRLNLRGLGTKDFKYPFGKGQIPGSSESTEQLPWAAAIWPNFKAEDWKCYYAGGVWESASKKLVDFDNGNSFKTEEWELRFYGDKFPDKPDASQLSDGESDATPSFGLIGTVLKQMPVKLTGVPRAVELVISGRIMGSMPIVLKSLPENMRGRRCDIAIDFGTSNTCMAFKEEGSDTAKPLALIPGEHLFDTQLPYMTALLGPRKAPNEKEPLAEKFFKSPRAPVFHFQSFNKLRKDGVPGSIPSELINLRSPSHSGQTLYLQKYKDEFERDFGLDKDLCSRPKSMQQAVVTPHFTPFPPDPGGLESATDLAQFLGAGLHRGFKWPAAVGDGTENYGFRSVYLEQILMAACASLRWAGIRDVTRFVGTYPHAFEESYRETYKNHLSKLVKFCFAQSGLKLSLATGVLMKSETVSALASTDIGRDICVSIDMGGGTTDVGFVVPGMRNGEKDLFSFMSSVKYAGTDLLRALVKSPALTDLLGDVTDTDELKLDSLSIKIRQGVSLNKPSVSKVARAFFEALFEYVFGILSAITSNENFPKNKQINVYLFGNGFKLINVFLGIKPEDFLKDVINSLKTAGLFTPEIAARIQLAEQKGDAKLALIEGALYGKVGGGDASDESRSQKLLREVEDEGHGRVAIWYPCIRKPGGPVSQVTLGTKAERLEMVLDNSALREALSVDLDDMSALTRSFPITSKYWADTKALTAIFNNAPQKNLVSLGSYYLEGREGVNSSFARVVLPVLAASTSAGVSHGNF